MTDLELKFDILCTIHGIPRGEPEFRFYPPRRWKFDVAWRDKMIAVELEGGAWVNGRHVRPAGFIADCSKYNCAAMLGWTVFRFTGDMLDNPRNLDMLKEALS